MATSFTINFPIDITSKHIEYTISEMRLSGIVCYNRISVLLALKGIFDDLRVYCLTDKYYHDNYVNVGDMQTALSLFPELYPAKQSHQIY